MAKTGYLDLDSAQEQAYFNSLNSGDRFINACVQRKTVLFSYRRKKGVSRKSLLPACSSAWSLLSSVEKDAWTLAGSYCNLNGWRLFVRDYCYRVINGLIGVSVPNIYYQDIVGRLQIDSPANELKIFQPHPYRYYISKKVSGKKGMYEPFAVVERLSLPLKIGLSYKADLLPAVGYSALCGVCECGYNECGDVQDDNHPFCKFYAVVRRLYQGVNIDTNLEIYLDFTSDFKIVSNTLSNILGQFTGYSLYFHLNNLTGSLFVDNIISEHGSQNWARDPSCNDIHRDFTRAFYQVPAHWSAVTIPSGSFFESEYFIS